MFNRIATRGGSSTLFRARARRARCRERICHATHNRNYVRARLDCRMYMTWHCRNQPNWKNQKTFFDRILMHFMIRTIELNLSTYSIRKLNRKSTRQTLQTETTRKFRKSSLNFAQCSYGNREKRCVLQKPFNITIWATKLNSFNAFGLGMELAFETSSTNHMPYLGDTFFLMNVLGCLVVSGTCIWYRTRPKKDFNPIEYTELELCPHNRPEFTNNLAQGCRTKPAVSINLVCSMELLFETSPGNHITSFSPKLNPFKASHVKLQISRARTIEKFRKIVFFYSTSPIFSTSPIRRYKGFPLYYFSSIVISLATRGEPSTLFPREDS